jgi:hypothetical protein
MLWCALGMGFTMVLLAGLYIETGNGNQAAQAVSVLCLFVFNCWFTIGWLGMSWSESPGPYWFWLTFQALPRRSHSYSDSSTRKCAFNRFELALELFRRHVSTCSSPRDIC